ncbi:hypothetical protein Acr_00g0087030 [Actinidia rufa]|uniref:Uncharacterized protein n=1 Tax=Actinidia rufa TaxID=165716 RepID=A0A7J0DW70_9ERIC|nr:hypothetical protein Acr_00g0087030 [Actinidia rufa]
MLSQTRPTCFPLKERSVSTTHWSSVITTTLLNSNAPKNVCRKNPNLRGLRQSPRRITRRLGTISAAASPTVREALGGDVQRMRLLPGRARRGRPPETPCPYIGHHGLGVRRVPRRPRLDFSALRRSQTGS